MIAISFADEGYEKFLGALPRLEHLDEDKNANILGDDKFQKFATFRERVFSGYFDAEMCDILGTNRARMMPPHSK